MKKEVLLAIVLGIGAGLIVTFGIYTANRAVQQNSQKTLSGEPKTSQSPQETPLPASQSSINKDLDLRSPENESISSVPSVILAGSTFPKATLLVLVNNADSLFTADANGQFAIPITLTAGSNQIVVYAGSPDGRQAQAQRVVVFSTADLNASMATPSATPKATPKTTTTPKKVASPSPRGGQ